MSRPRIRAKVRGAVLMLAFGCLGANAPAGEASDIPALKYENPTSLTGTLYDQSGSNVLFKFKRTATRYGTNLHVLREYTSPDGTLAARERVVYEGNRLLTYALDELQTGANGSAKILHSPADKAPGKIEFEYAVANGRLDKAVESLRPDTLTSDMVAPFLTEHWADLLEGREVKCRYLVVPRKETVGFTFARQSETEWRGVPAVVVRMEPSSWIIRQIVDPLFFTVEKEGQHRVLQYTGRTTPKMKSKNGWKDLDAVTVFDWD